MAQALGLRALSASKVDSMERSGTTASAEQAQVAAETLDRIMRGTLFGRPPAGDLKAKQQKPDTLSGWDSVQRYAARGVPYGVFLHQRHYGGAFRQVLDATSELRGDLIEDAVEALRVNDTLGPVVQDCDGRVFSVSNLAQMLTIAPFISLTH